MSGHIATWPYGGRHATQVCGVRLPNGEICGREYYSNGMCRAHRERTERNGGPQAGTPIGKENHTLPEGMAARNQILNDYRQGAKKHSREWGLTIDQCEELFQSDCYYCGAEPSNVKSGNRMNGDYTYNGIDRVDNDRGYTPDNVVPCCRDCNMGKHDMSPEQYIDHCKKVADMNEIENPTAQERARGWGSRKGGCV